MESVGPVETGHKSRLPDLCRVFHPQPDLRICTERESKDSYPPYPQPVRNTVIMWASVLANAPVVGVEFRPMLVRSFLPWFMPVFLHKRKIASRQ